MKNKLDKFSLSSFDDNGKQTVIGEDWTVDKFERYFNQKGYIKKPNTCIVGFYFASPDGDAFELVPSFHKKGEVIKFLKGGNVEKKIFAVKSIDYKGATPQVKFHFNADNLEDAISKGKGWGRYHSFAYGEDYIVEEAGKESIWLHNEWIFEKGGDVKNSKTVFTKDGVEVEKGTDKYKGRTFYSENGDGYECLGYFPKADECMWKNLKTDALTSGCMDGFYWENPAIKALEKYETGGEVNNGLSEYKSAKSKHLELFNKSLFEKGGNVGSTKGLLIGDILKHNKVHYTVIQERSESVLVYKSNSFGTPIPNDSTIVVITDNDMVDYKKIGHTDKIKYVEKEVDGKLYRYWKVEDKKLDAELSLFDIRYQFFNEYAPEKLKKDFDKLENDNHHFESAVLVKGFFDNIDTFRPDLKTKKAKEYEKGGEITAKYIGDDDWSRKLYKGTDGKIYADVDGVLHYITNEGEPLYPARNVKIDASDVPELSDDEKFKNMMADRDRQNEEYEKNQLPRLKSLWSTGGAVKIDEDEISVRVLTDNGFKADTVNSVIFEDKPNMLIGTEGTKGEEIALVFIVGGEYHPDEFTLITKEHLREIKDSYHKDKVIHIFTNAGVELHSQELKQDEWKNLKIHKIGEGYIYKMGGEITKEEYSELLEKYNKITGQYEDLEDEPNEVLKAQLKKEIDETEAKIHRYERSYGKGGGFDKLARKVAKEYEGDKVSKEYQDEYGRTYSHQEALEVGEKVAAKIYHAQQKMKDGGEFKECLNGLEVESILFDKSKFTRGKAKAWAKKHDFNFGKSLATENNIRLRQKSLHLFKRNSFRTIEFGDKTGIKAIVACPK